MSAMTESPKQSGSLHPEPWVQGLLGGKIRVSLFLMEKEFHDERRKLRRKLRAARNRLSCAEQTLAGRNLLKVLLTQRVFLRSQNIALYMPNDGEISPLYVADWCRKNKKKLYLPHIRRHKKGFLWFLPWPTSSALKQNHYGLLEPDLNALAQSHRWFAPWRLDLLLMPLVGFDKKGNRLGMGGGFYDRTLGPCKWKTPRLIGLAHSCQEVSQLPVAPWDIPLQGICTDQNFYCFKK